MLPFEEIAEFIHQTWVRPARESGEKTVTVDVREVCQALSYTYSADLVRSVLGSMRFRNTYRLPLAATGGPSEGPPTTYTFKAAPCDSASAPRSGPEGLEEGEPRAASNSTS
jgi:hypothetical protein